MNIKEEVNKDLRAQEEIGIPIPAKAYEYPEAEIIEFYDNGMSIEEIADLVLDLTSM